MLQRSLAYLFLLAFLFTACSTSEPAVAPPSADDADAPYFTPEPAPTYRFDGLRVGTLNTEFMFDGEGDEGQATFAHKGNPELSKAHRAKIGEAVLMLDVDVLMLQEVENQNALDLLIEETLADQGYTGYFIEGRDSFTGQDIALLSRIPADTLWRTNERVNVGTTQRTYGVSKNLVVRMMLGDVPTTLIGLHFLSRPDDVERKPRREAQAEVIRRVVEAEHAAGRAVIALGDFNDFDNATPDRSGNAPITDVLSMIKSAGAGTDDDLVNVMADVPQIERFTAFYDRNRNGVVQSGELSAIDHVLLSPDLYRRVREVQFVQAYDPNIYTDHFPIVVTLDL